MNEVDLLIVNPSNTKNVYGELGETLAGVEPPLWGGLLAAYVREGGYSVSVIDADAEHWPVEILADRILEYEPGLLVVGATGSNPSASSTPKMEAAGKLVGILKRSQIQFKTLIYGIHPSALPGQTLLEEDVDFVCRGEAFNTVRELLGAVKAGNIEDMYSIEGLWYLKNGKPVDMGWSKIVRNLDDMPDAAWDLLPMDKYRAHNWHCFGHINERSPYAVIYTSLGCPYSCQYCNIHALYEGHPGIRYRSMERVAREIEMLNREYGVKNFKILDELFAVNETRVREFCSKIGEERDLNFWAYARIDTVNESMLTMMKKSGINWLAYGIEAGSQKVREDVTKGRFDHNKIKRVIEMTQRAGINVLGNFMFGLPEDDMESMRQTLELAKELRCEYVNFYTTMAYPGSKLYETAVKNGWRLPDRWSGYSQLSKDTVPLPTKYLSSDKILRFRDEAFKEYFTDPDYISMVEDKFGKETVEHIKDMLKKDIRRELLQI